MHAAAAFCCLLCQIMLALILHRQEPKNWTVDKVAGQLKLPREDVVNLFKYYGVFQEVRNRDSEDLPGITDTDNLRRVFKPGP